MNKPILYIGKVHKTILIINIVITAIYMSWWLNFGHIGNPLLYFLLLFGEIYHVFMAFSFWSTIWPRRNQITRIKRDLNFLPTVDIFITVAGEPLDVIRQTAIAAKNLLYDKKKIFILNDGFVAGKENWREVEKLAQDIDVYCITRKVPGGAKAGNINNGLNITNGEIIVIFDADMVPNPEFLQKVIPFFQRKETGFVQTPQYYENHAQNMVTAGAWDQQSFFFGPIMQGKAKENSAFICGTNVAISRKALMEVGGMCETSIAEDFLTSLFIHQKGWKSYYLPEILSRGLAPADLQSYYNQQLRWARGSLEILFAHNPLFNGNLTWHQKIEYLSSALYYFNGVIMLIDMLMPLVFLFTGIQPVAASTASFAIFFIPFMVMNLYTLYLASDGTFTFRAISFSQSSWTLQLLAIISVLLKRKMAFKVTPKKAQQGNFLYLVSPHILYTVLAVCAFVVGVAREALNPSVITNIAWAFFNMIMFFPFVSASNTKIEARNNEKINITPAY